eukprot:g5523.t1
MTWSVKPFLTHVRGDRAWRRERDRLRSRRGILAVIHAEGQIQSGRKTRAGQRVIAAETLIADLERALRDRLVKGVVLRIDSPGGDPCACDSITRSVLRLQAAGKPVFASMGSVAASGGYWIASQCDAIYCSPMTLTGSIGVIGGNLAIGDFLKSYGVDADGFTTHENSTPALPFYHGLSESQREVSRRLIDRMYAHFVKRVSVHRTDGDVATIERVAKGRVWLGSQAARNGLVEEAAPFVPSVFRRRVFVESGGKKQMTTVDKRTEEDDLPLMEIYPKPSEDFWARLTTAVQVSRGGNGPFPPSASDESSIVALLFGATAESRHSGGGVLENILDGATSTTPLERLALTAGRGNYVPNCRVISDADAGFAAVAEFAGGVFRGASGVRG